jgi:hypothetical protein
MQQSMVIIVLAAIGYQFRAEVAQMAVERMAPSTMKPWAPGAEFTALSWANMLQQSGVTGGCCIANSWATIDKVFCSDEMSLIPDAIPILAGCTHYVKGRSEWPIKTFNHGVYVGNITIKGTGQFEIKSARIDPEADGYVERVGVKHETTDACKMVAKCRESPSDKQCKALKNSITWCL